MESDFFKELQRISKTVKNSKDAEILRKASYKLIKSPECVKKTTQYIENYGLIVHRQY